MTHKRKKEAIRNFMQAHYSDQQLASLLAHARDGKLSYHSCCCFIGQPTADHALKSIPEAYERSVMATHHYQEALNLPGANSAELAYLTLGCDLLGATDDRVRRRILIPMILAEMRRRERSRAYVIGVDVAIGSSYTRSVLAKV